MNSSIDSEIESQLSSKPKIPWAPLVRSRALSAISRIASANGDRRDREVVGAQAQRRQADEEPEARS